MIHNFLIGERKVIAKSVLSNEPHYIKTTSFKFSEIIIKIKLFLKRYYQENEKLRQTGRKHLQNTQPIQDLLLYNAGRPTTIKNGQNQQTDIFPTKTYGQKIKT